jgi:hypothetical protein
MRTGLAFLVAACVVVGSCAQALIETPFQRIQYGAANTVVILYWLNDPLTDAASRELLDSAETVARVSLLGEHATIMVSCTDALAFERCVYVRACVRMCLCVCVNFQNVAAQYPQLRWIKCNAAEHYTDLLQAQIEKKMLPIAVFSIDGMGELPCPAVLSAHPFPSHILEHTMATRLTARFTHTSVAYTCSAGFAHGVSGLRWRWLCGADAVRLEGENHDLFSVASLTQAFLPDLQLARLSIMCVCECLPRRVGTLGTAGARPGQARLG